MYNIGLEITVGTWTLTNGDAILSDEILLLLGTMTIKYLKNLCEKFFLWFYWAFKAGIFLYNIDSYKLYKNLFILT